MFRLAAVAVLLGALAGFTIARDAGRGAYDFQAFYCAGDALRAHADPYRAQPLGSCERRVTDGTYAALPPGVILPAPQPSYDIAAFALLALLPFAAAKALWGAILGGAIGLAAICTYGATRASLGVVLMAFAASLVLPALAFGELFALFAAAACAAMFFASRERWTAAGIAAGLSLVEPHLGIPLCASLALWNVRTRLPLALCITLLGVVGFAAAGWAQNMEYATIVLPLHALAERSSDAQLSLTAVLHAFGVPDTPALRLGMISYGLAAVLGVWLARILAVRFRENAFLVAVPAAFATIGGTFMHVTEVFAAIPLALLLATRKNRLRPLAAFALVLLAVPWYAVLDGGLPWAFAAIAAIVVFYLTWQHGARPAVSLLMAIVAGGILAYAPSMYVPVAHAFGSQEPAASAFAQVSWRALNESRLSSSSAISWWLRGASWAGLVALAAASARARLTVNVN